MKVTNSRIRAAVIIFAVSFLGIIMYTHYGLNLDSSMMTPDSFYRGNREKMVIDPREYYNTIHGLSSSLEEEDMCKTERFQANSNIPFGLMSAVMYTSVESNDSTDFIELIGVDGSGTFKKGQEIIMPLDHYQFKNSNFEDSSLEDNLPGGEHNIEIIGLNGTGKYVIVFEDVMTWWCHAHNPSQNVEHTAKVGNISNSEAKDMSKGFVLGIANDTTKIKVYKIKDEFYNADGDSKITAGSDKLCMDHLEQLHAGKFLYALEEYVVS